MLCHHRDYHCRIFRALALVDGNGISRDQHVKFAKAVGDTAAIEDRRKFTVVAAYSVDVPNVAVIDILVVVIFDLHDLVPWGEGPAKPLDLMIAGRIQNSLQLDIERASSDAASVHRAK